MNEMLNMFILIAIAYVLSCSACDSGLSNQFQMDVGGFKFEWEIVNKGEITIQLSIKSNDKITYLGIGFGTGMLNTVRICINNDVQLLHVEYLYSYFV